MTKPILVVTFPTSQDTVNIISFGDMLDKKIGDDYHVILIQDNDKQTGLDFQCFNHNLPEIEFEDLKNKLRQECGLLSL